jgi:hypothetical protein
MTSKSNYATTMTNTYTAKTRANFEKFKDELISRANLHSNKYDSIILDGKLDPIVKRKIKNELKSLGEDFNDASDDADISARATSNITEYLDSYKREAYNIIKLNIADTAEGNIVKKEIERYAVNDGHKAFNIIREKWEINGKDGRIHLADQALTDHLTDGAANGSLLAMTAFVETMLDLNKELENTDFHRKPAQHTTVVLREVSRLYPEVARTINASKVSVSNWRADFDTFYKELVVILEENDCTTTLASNTERRDALRTKVHEERDSSSDSTLTLARMRDEIEELKRAYSTRPAPGPLPALPPCADCGFGHKGVCIGKVVTNGTMTRDAAKEKLLGPGIKDKDAAVDRCVARYKAYNGVGDKPTDAGAGAPFRPAKKLVACTRVSIGSIGVGHAPAEGDTVRVDSCADMHVFGDLKYFPFGVDRSRSFALCTIAHDDGGDLPPIPCEGIGTAVFMRDGVEVHLSEALCCMASRQNLISIPQLMEKGITLDAGVGENMSKLIWPSGDEVHFGHLGHPFVMDICDIPGAGSTGRLSRSLDTHTLTTPLLTRGTTAGGQQMRLTIGDTTQLWGMRTGLGAQALKELPASTDAPDKLSKATPVHRVDHDRLLANFPKLPTTSSGYTRGRVIVTDLHGPETLSVHGNNRYCANFIIIDEDGDQQYNTFFLNAKSDFPTALEDLLNLGDFSGYTLYSDNEWVLNSGKVKGILRRRDMPTQRNSCEYEPWQNGAVERSFRTLAAFSREYIERAFSDNEEAQTYWPYGFNHGANVYNAMNDKYDDGRISHLRVPFCLCYVRTPHPYRSGKLSPQSEAGMHLGWSRNKPGYAVEILEGPRKGKVVTASQVIFWENWFPKKNGLPSKPPTGADEAFDAMAAFDDDDDGDDPFQPISVDARGDVEDPGDTRDDDEGDDVGDPGADETPDADDDDASDDETNDKEDAPDPAPPARRSARNAGGILPQTALGYTALDSLTKRSRAYTTCVDGLEAAVPAATGKAPRSYGDIAKISDVALRSEWYKAHFKEVDRLFDNPELLEAIPFDKTGKLRSDLLRLRTLYKIKSDSENTKKARTVLGGHMIPKGSQGRTFSPTARPTTLRALCALAPNDDLVVSMGDVTQAYGQGKWPDHIPKAVAHMPEGYERFHDGIEYVVRVGNLYGGLIAGRNWWKTNDKFLRDCGLTKSEYDDCLYIRRRGDAVLYVLVYVDDIVTFHTRGSTLRDEFVESYGGRFDWTDFGTDLEEFLSVRITQSGSTVKLDMSRYISDLATEVFPGGPHATYAVPARQELPKMVHEALDGKDTTHSTDTIGTRYRYIVAASLYVATMVRPDVALAVGLLTRCMAYPSESLLREAERVLIYLYHTRDLGLEYRKTPTTVVDMDWAPSRGPITDGDSDANFEPKRSTSGYMFTLFGTAISWCVRRQQSIALSTTEAEFMAGSLAACEAVYLRGLMGEFGHEQSAPTVLRLDNSGAINLAHDAVQHTKSKHIARRYFHIRELIDDKVIKVIYVKSADNRADWLTKPLSKDVFQKHRSAAGIA